MKTILRLVLALAAVLLVSCDTTRGIRPFIVFEVGAPTARPMRPAQHYYNPQPRPVMRQPVMLPQPPCGGGIVGCNPASPYGPYNSGYGQGYGGGYQEMYPRSNLYNYTPTVPRGMPMAVWMAQGRPMPQMGPRPQQRRR